MVSSRNIRIGLVVVVASLIVLTPIVLLSFQNNLPPDDVDDNDAEDNAPLELPVSSVNVTLLHTAGVMIEVNNIRIYIDPYRIPKSNFSDYPADLILVTHAHTDHYSPYDIGDVQKNSTLVVFPESMTTAFERFNNSMGVSPGDNFQYRGINITAFDLYLEDYPSGAISAHPKNINWTSYIIDIEGFTIFHAGDAKYMDEYVDFPVDIDVAFLPIYFDPGYGEKEESLAPIIQAIEVLKPEYCIPTHWYFDDNELFMQEYVPLLVDDCVVMNIGFFESYVFSV